MPMESISVDLVITVDLSLRRRLSQSDELVARARRAANRPYPKDYRFWERDVAEPALIALGYQWHGGGPPLWITQVQDSVTRSTSVIDSNGKWVRLFYEVPTHAEEIRGWSEEGRPDFYYPPRPVRINGPGVTFVPMPLR